ncbi:outer membrane protein [Shimia gijangensis]|uniref:Outer membrane protein n=1 Tax=Shimia gijangensis TaxID=1470563 RepID=A0A1M6H1X0_9RHOB|nr:TolC family outer membrane protein [Shimia gijangensis]SHJ16155.1 outer membrane protein [Shimia gijangensis]
MALRMLKSLRSGALALSLSFAMPVAAVAENLADAMASAYEHSGLLEQNRALLRAADEGVAQTYASLRPILNWYGSISNSFGTSASLASAGLGTTIDTSTASIGITLQILLYDNGQSRNLIAAAKETVLSTRQSLIVVEQSVLLDAVQAFMNVVRDTQIVELRQNNLRLVERELQAAKDRFEVGEVTRTDVAQAEASLAGGRADLARAQGDLMQSQEFYSAAIGHRPGRLVAPRTLPRGPTSMENAKAVAIRSHPSMTRAKYDISTAEYNVDAAESALGPRVTLDGNYAVQEDLNHSYYNHAGTIGLTLGGPIYRGGQLSSILRQAMAQRDAQRANLHVVRHTTRQNAGNAWAALASAKAQLSATGRQVEAARIAFEGVREEAKLGARTTLDVLIAEQALLDAEASRITAQTSQFTAAFALLASMGLLTTEHLNLKVERYDPLAYYDAVKDAPALLSERGKKLDKVLRALGKE